jgi:hypothetical protein
MIIAHSKEIDNAKNITLLIRYIQGRENMCLYINAQDAGYYMTAERRSV